jgi:adenine-specific DNA-methyltransferase
LANYENLTKEQLIERIQELESKRFGLIWNDEKEPENVVIECKKNIPILNKIEDNTIATDEQKPNNILIEGDNYHALQVLNYTHIGKVDVIYIDPPYNTGNKDFKYNDNYIDRENSYRHSKWLSFMEKRLKLAHNLLKEDGVIFISIGNDEIAQLKLLMDKIFGEKKDNNIVHWKKNQKPQNASSTMSESAEFLLVYFSNKSIKLVRPMTGTKIDDRGSYKPTPLFKFDGRQRRIQIIPKGTNIEAKSWEQGKIYGVRNKLAYIEVLDTPIIINNILQNDIELDGEWAKTNTNGEYQKVVDDNRLFINSNGFPSEKSYRDKNSFNVQTNLWLDAGYNELGKSTLDEILGKDNVFSFPKPKEYIKEILKSVNKEDAVVLDFFAGSGTTAHAVLELNKEDDGNRQFILCTNNEVGEKDETKFCKDNNIKKDELKIWKKNKRKKWLDYEKLYGICSTVTYPRIDKVIKGYDFIGDDKTIVYEDNITFSNIYKSVKQKKTESDKDYILRKEKAQNENIIKIWKDIDNIIIDNESLFDTIKKDFENNKIKITGIKSINGFKDGLGGNLDYYQTDKVSIENFNIITDMQREALTYKAGNMIAIKEDTHLQIELNKHYQIFKDNFTERYTAIYFTEDLENFDELIDKIKEYKTTLYIYSYGKIDKSSFKYLGSNFRIEDIPEPIIDIYKEINKEGII